MRLILKRQNEVVNDLKFKFNQAIENRNKPEASQCYYRWIEESKKLDILEDLNLMRDSV
jgi:hypothetical protein